MIVIGWIPSQAVREAGNGGSGRVTRPQGWRQIEKLHEQGMKMNVVMKRWEEPVWCLNGPLGDESLTGEKVKQPCCQRRHFSPFQNEIIPGSVQTWTHGETREQRRLNLHSHAGEAGIWSKTSKRKVAGLLSQSRWVNFIHCFVCLNLSETNTRDDWGVFFSCCRRTLVLICRMTATPSMAFQVSTRARRTWLSPHPPKSAHLVSRWWRKWR